MKIQWNRSDQGYTDSKDGRFAIVPETMGTTRAQGYRLRDNQTGRTYSEDTQGSAKRTAQRIVDTGRPW